MLHKTKQADEATTANKKTFSIWLNVTLFWLKKTIDVSENAAYHHNGYSRLFDSYTQT